MRFAYMRLIYYTIAASLIIGFVSFSSGCRKEESKGDGRVELVCRATWEGEPIVIGASLEYPQGFALKFYVLDYLMSNARLEAASGNMHALTDVQLVSFTESNETSASAEEGIRFLFDQVPADAYRKLTIGIGLDAEKNATKPQSYPSGHPLSIGANRYWDAWGSYIFSKVQGLADDEKPGVFNHPFSYHSGGTELYREVVFDKAIMVQEGQVTRLELELDVKKLFLKSDGTFWDVSGSSQAHEPLKPALVMIADNYANALMLK